MVNNNSIPKDYPNAQSLESIQTADFKRSVPIVRVHAHLLRHSWIKVWYLLRSQDLFGRGLLDTSFAEALSILNCASSTFYQWLRGAKKHGAIYEYSIKGDRLRVRLGSLFNVCHNLGLTTWGATAEVELNEVITNARALASVITTQQLQQQSRYAARQSLSNREKKSSHIPSPMEFLERTKTASLKPSRGATTKNPYLIHMGKKRAFVSFGFIPYGTSQSAIASELEISDRTVRRHLNKMEVESRQICQTKQDYREIQAAVRYQGGDYVSESGIRVQVYEDRLIMRERNGYSQTSKTGKIEVPINDLGSHSTCDRFFNYFGQTWFYRCSIYALDRHLNKMRFSRKKYKEMLTTPQNTKQEQE